MMSVLECYDVGQCLFLQIRLPGRLLASTFGEAFGQDVRQCDHLLKAGEPPHAQIAAETEEKFTNFATMLLVLPCVLCYLLGVWAW